MLANTKIRTTAKEKGIRLWEVANALGISEPTMTRKLRTELPLNEQQNILGIIDELAEEKENAACGTGNTTNG